MPLSWAHAEYIKLVRSVADGRVFDLIPEVANRYRNRPTGRPLEVWKFSRQVRSLPPGATLRIQAAASFRLHWTNDEWKQTQDTDSIPTGTGHEYADISVSSNQRAPVRFTFLWTNGGRWEGRDFQVRIDEERRGVINSTRQQ